MFKFSILILILISFIYDFKFYEISRKVGMKYGLRTLKSHQLHNEMQKEFHFLSTNIYKDNILNSRISSNPIVSNKLDVYHSLMNSPGMKKKKINPLLFLQVALDLDPNYILEIVAKYPNLLKMNAEKKLIPKLEMFLNLGFRLKDIKELFLKMPLIFLRINYAWTLPEKFKALQQFFFLDQKSAIQLVIKSPIILTLSIPRYFETSEFLTEKIGIPPEKVKKLAINCPSILTTSFEVLTNCIKVMKDVYSLSDKEITQTIIKYPHVLSPHLLSQLNERIQFLTENIVLPMQHYQRLKKNSRAVPQYEPQRIRNDSLDTPEDQSWSVPTDLHSYLKSIVLRHPFLMVKYLKYMEFNMRILQEFFEVLWMDESGSLLPNQPIQGTDPTELDIEYLDTYNSRILYARSLLAKVMTTTPLYLLYNPNSLLNRLNQTCQLFLSRKVKLNVDLDRLANIAPNRSSISIINRKAPNTSHTRPSGISRAQARPHHQLLTPTTSLSDLDDASPKEAAISHLNIFEDYPNNILNYEREGLLESDEDSELPNDLSANDGLAGHQLFSQYPDRGIELETHIEPLEESLLPDAILDQSRERSSEAPVEYLNGLDLIEDICILFDSSSSRSSRVPFQRFVSPTILREDISLSSKPCEYRLIDGQNFTLNMKPKSLLKILKLNPFVLSYRLERTVSIINTLIVTMGLDHAEIAKALQLYPRLCSFSIESRVQKILRLLSEAIAEMHPARKGAQYDVEDEVVPLHLPIRDNKSLRNTTSEWSLYRMHPIRKGLREIFVKYPLILGTSLKKIRDTIDVLKRNHTDWSYFLTVLRRSSTKNVSNHRKNTSNKCPPPTAQLNVKPAPQIGNASPNLPCVIALNPSTHRNMGQLGDSGEYEVDKEAVLREDTRERNRMLAFESSLLSLNHSRRPQQSQNFSLTRRFVVLDKQQNISIDRHLRGKVFDPKTLNETVRHLIPFDIENMH